jgi:hypothetical protein
MRVVRAYVVSTSYRARHSSSSRAAMTSACLRVELSSCRRATVLALKSVCKISVVSRTILMRAVDYTSIIAL